MVCHHALYIFQDYKHFSTGAIKRVFVNLVVLQLKTTSKG